MTPATAQSLSFDSEGNAGNAHENFREPFAIERIRRGRRLENPVRAGDELGAIANPASYHLAGRSRQAWIEDRAARRQRVGEDTVRGNFVADSGVEDGRGGVAVEIARNHLPLDDFRPCRPAPGGERVATRDHDRP